MLSWALITIVYHRRGGRLVEFSPPEVEAQVLRESQTIPRICCPNYLEIGSLSASPLPPCCQGPRLHPGRVVYPLLRFSPGPLRRSRTAAIPCSIAHLLRNTSTTKATSHIGKKIV